MRLSKPWLRWLLLLALCLGKGGLAAAQGRFGSSSAGQQAFDEALAALNNDDFSAAEVKFKQAIALDDNLVEAYWRLAGIYYRDHRYREAVEWLRRSPNQSDIDIREQLGLNLYKSAVPPPVEAVSLLETAVRERASSYTAHLQLCQHWLRSDAERAAKHCVAYLESRPASMSQLDAQARELLGTAYLISHHWDRAEATLEELLQAKPHDLNATLLLAAALTGKRDGDARACPRAIAIYERLAKEAVRQPSIYFNLGSCYLKTNRLAEALQKASRYVVVKPGDLKGQLLLGDVQFALQQYPLALASFNAAQRLDRNDMRALIRVGLTDLKLRNYDAAIAELERAAVAEPRHVGRLCGLIEAYGIRGHHAKVLERGNELAALSPDTQALKCAGQAYYSLASVDGDAQAALVLARLLSIVPNDAEGRTALVRVLNRQAGRATERSDLHQAEALLHQAEERLGDDLMTHRNLALVLVMQQRFEVAEALLQNLFKKVPNDVTVNRLLARALLGLSRRDAAVQVYERAAVQAARSGGVELATVYSELGPVYLEVHQLDQAIFVLEKAVHEAKAAPVGRVAERNLAIAYFRRGSERMQEGKQVDAAYADLSRAMQFASVLSAKETNSLSCSLWLVALKSSRVAEARVALATAKNSGGCRLKAPYDHLGVGFVEAYTEYSDGQNIEQREAAAKHLQQLSSHLAGSGGEVVRQLLRSTYEWLTFAYFARRQEDRASRYLSVASKVATAGDTSKTLQHNEAVLSLGKGKLSKATETFELLSPRLPEALVNLGLIRDRQGDSRGALGYYRRALDHGARSPKLKEWIDVNQRIFAGEP